MAAGAGEIIMALDVRSIYVTALQNTHALEMQALQIMERQVERLEHYPELAEALNNHIRETHGQRQRLEAELQALGETPSTIKEGVLGLMGNMAALAHAPAQDEILKNTFANQAFENYEIAAYRSLLTMADGAGRSQSRSALEQSLHEEEAMANRVASLVVPITRRYLSLSAGGMKADR